MKTYDYFYIDCWLVVGISTLVGYLMPNPIYTYILNLYMQQARAHLFSQF